MFTYFFLLSTAFPLIPAFFLPLHSSSTIPGTNCAASNSSYSLSLATSKYTNFCDKLAKKNYTTDVMMYGLPVIEFGYEETKMDCDPTKELSCEEAFGNLVDVCKTNNETLYGSGSIESGCGVYNFSIFSNTSTSATPATGTNIATTSTSAASAEPTTGTPLSSATVVKASGFMLAALAGFVVWFL